MTKAVELQETENLKLKSERQQVSKEYTTDCLGDFYI